ncbi:hypothetical protein KI387_002297 [Taxus chinensis]|uniref:Uncharacterized protein n=1 Tax=Taxus chinensis TaxID=29808 RepID=A0AA38GV14_TAXCH|nr:hypothetical protein KI387_002297 [Taxus chinensis]
MEKGGGSNSESWRRSRSDEAVSWRNKSSTTNDTWSRTYGRGRSPQTSSWRRSSSSSSSEDSWRQRQPLNHSDVTGGVGGISRAPGMQRGKVVTLNLSEGYGFLAPIVRDVQQNSSYNNLYFRLGENSKSETGLFELQVGDVLEYISNDSNDSPRILYACLLECKMRSLEDLLAYLDILLMHSVENPARVLREITKCPVGFLQILNYENPPLYFVRSVVELVRIISEHNEAPLYATRLKMLYRVFSGTVLLQRALREFHSQIEEKRVKNFLMDLATHNPESVADTLPLLNDMLKTKGGEELDCHCQFLLHILTAQVGNAISACNLEWNKMQLVPLESEITGSGTEETSMETHFKGLPYVKKQGSYGSVEVYMDTYFRLLKEDCFWGLKKGISDLRKNKWDRRDMRIWPNGVAIGLHFGGSRSGVTIAVNTERVYGSRRPMEGNLLCLSDDGGNFDSPIWGIVAHCEDSTKKGMLSVFAEIVDGRDGFPEVEIEGLSRLLLASRIVIAESPTFYKAYQPVLKALQGKDLENFPFADELVFTNWPSIPPQYLTPLTTLDWSCLFNKGDTESLSDESLHDKLIFPSFWSSARAPIDELDKLFKCGHRTSFDESQIEAIKLALSNRLVLIQGPPGTGKTYVGVRLLQLLLTADTLPTGPILVMTYKNHGLDNFLMGCLKFCKNLVRVGRRSNEPSLEEYNLHAKVGKMGAFYHDRAEYRDMLEKVQYRMEEAFMKLRESNVFDSETVISHMPDSQMRLLLSKHESDKHLLKSFPENIPLVEWTRGRIGRNMDTRHLVTLLYKSISKNIREWMPHKKTFELVENCFSLCKPSREICEIRFQRVVKESNYLEEAEQDLSEDEFVDEIISGLQISRENESWLEENFLYLRGEDKDNLFSKRVNLHIDIDKYRWLLNENPWQLNEHCRVLLVHVIMQTQYELGLKRLVDFKKNYNEVCGMMKEINEQRQLEVLQSAAIVGMTTAGASMYINVLKVLRPSIVFVEEASEVLEPQLLAVLEPSMQHLILIGDHCQLSPHVACYELERCHDFSVSMFERLAEHNKFPFQSLSVQSRMREEFLPMILPIYPHVRSNTKLVRGEKNQAPACMKTPMYFWDHSFPETSHEHGFANPQEAEMVVALLTWMTAEGESPEQITVLAAYNGQVSLLKDKLKKHRSAKDVHVYSIDRFQVRI